MAPRVTGATLFAFAFCFAGAAHAAEGVVEAVGEAMIKKGDKVAAKKEATADGLKKCIEQVVGISIRSDFSAEQREVVKNNESQFYSDVSDKLVQQSEGFIQRYEVLDEQIQGDVMKVKVRAHVFESKIKAEVKKLADLLLAAGNPRLMVVVQDIVIKSDGAQEVQADSVLAAHLEKELLARGIELRGGNAAKKLAGVSSDAYDKWLNDPAAAAETARGHGADMLIAGRVEIRDKGKISKEDSGGLDSLVGQTRIEIVSIIRGVNAATGEVFSSEPVQTASVGTNLERASHRAFRGRGKNLIKRTFGPLLEDLKASFRKTAEKGQSYVVRLNGVRSFRRQAKPFMKVLQAVSGVSDVKQKAFKKNHLVIDLFCKCTATELQDRIFSAVGADSTFESLDVEGVSGKRLTFTL